MVNPVSLLVPLRLGIRKSVSGLACRHQEEWKAGVFVFTWHVTRVKEHYG